MNEDLLKAYEHELTALQAHGAYLARVSPNRAGTLARLLEDVRDPFVNQLVQAFAYAVARVDLKLEAERQRVPAAVLQALHPTALRPVPARAVLRFKAGPDAAIPAAGLYVPAGTRLAPRRTGDVTFRSDPAATAPVEFRTCHASVVPPVRITKVEMLPPGDGESRHRLRLTLASSAAGATKLSDVQIRSTAGFEQEAGGPGPASPAAAAAGGRRPDPAAAHGFRVFLGGARREVSLALYRALTRHPVECQVRAGATLLGRVPNAVRPAGMGPDEALLPPDPRQHEALRLLTEYAVVPDKFLFVDLVGLAPRLFAGAGATVEIELLVESYLAAQVSLAGLADVALHLGCVPAVNLEAVQLPAQGLKRTEAELLLQVDPQVQPTHRDELPGPVDRREVFSIDEVRATRRGKPEVQYVEAYSPLPVGLALNQRSGGYWFARRERRSPCEYAPGGYDDVLVSLAEFDPKRSLEPGLTLHVSATCLSRKTEWLNDRGVEFAGPHGAFEPVTPVLPPAWPDVRGDAGHRLVELLSCGAGLFHGSEDARSGLARLLSLVASLFPGDKGVADRMDPGFIRGAQVRPVAAGVAGGLARGTALTLSIAPPGSGHEAYLLLRILDHAVAAYCAAGAFTQLSAKHPDAADAPGKPRKPNEWPIECPPRVGHIALT